MDREDRRAQPSPGRGLAPLVSSPLRVRIGQHSERGCKPVNQDFHGACLPTGPALASKGVALALADGISSSDVSQIASETAVKAFLSDYFCTPEAWSVKTSAQRVLVATNAWLFEQTRQSQHRYDKDRGFVCTFSALILKASTAYVFHVGDTRIYRWRAGTLEQLTRDHRVWVSKEQSHLARALGVNPQLEIDYQALALERGDVFLLASDGVYEYLSEAVLAEALQTSTDDLDALAQALVQQALAQGSTDNLSAQIVRVDALPEQQAAELQHQVQDLLSPPLLEARALFDGYRIVRELHASSRSHVHLAVEEESQQLVALKTPSLDLRDEPAYRERFLMEEWVARRIHSPHVLRAHVSERPRRHLYTACEFVDGQTLRQWMADHPRPELGVVRGIVTQIAKGLQAFHRLEMLHQDLRPDNVMIDGTGTVKIIDFGAVRVAGLAEAIGRPGGDEANPLPGTAAFMAPEYRLGEGASTASDVFSLGVLTYHLLTGELPYGAEMARARSPSELRQVRYRTARDDQRAIPAWVDEALEKAVHPQPHRRYAEASEFIQDLCQPNPAFVRKNRRPLTERHPLRFWQGVSLVLLLALFLQAALA